MLSLIFHLLRLAIPIYLPESRSRAHHVLAQGSERAIRTSTESDDIGCAEDETDYETDTLRVYKYAMKCIICECNVLPPIMAPIFTAQH